MCSERNSRSVDWSRQRLVAAVAVAITLWASGAGAGSELLARRVPPAGDPAEERRAIVGLAEGSGLQAVEVHSGVRAEGALSARLAELGVERTAHELTARGNLISVAALLHRLQFLPRPNVVDRFELTPLGPDEVRLSARVVFPFRALEGESGEATAELLSLVDRPVTALLALGELAYRIDGLPVALQRYRHEFPDLVTLDAWSAGSRTAAKLESALAGSGMTAASVTPRRRGSCVELAVSARVPVPTPAETNEPPSEIPDLPYEDFGYAVFAPLAVERCDPPAVPSAVRVERRADAGSGGGELRARGLERSEAMLLVERATGRPMVAFGDSAARFDLELHSLGPDETHAALTAAGIPVQRLADALLWTDQPPVQAAEPSYTGFPVSLQVDCVGLGDLVGLVGGLAELEIRGLPDRPGCVSAYATDRPWDELLDAVLAVAGLGRRSADTAIEIVVPPAASRPSEPRTAPEPSRLDPRKWRLPLTELAIEDLELIALVRPTPEAPWLAHARGPLGERYELTPETPLADAQVTAIDSEGITLSTPARTVRVDLR